MDKITRGTTPKIIIRLPEGLTVSDVTECWLTISQFGEQLANKTLDDMIPGNNGDLLVMLTQAETLKLCSCGGTVNVQARLRTTSDEAIASEVYNRTAGEILKDGEI